MNTPETLVKKIVQEQGTIQDVFLTACGGSLVDLYPGYYFINAESETMHACTLADSKRNGGISIEIFEKRSVGNPLFSRREYT